MTFSVSHYLSLVLAASVVLAQLPLFYPADWYCMPNRTLIPVFHTCATEKTYLWLFYSLHCKHQAINSWDALLIHCYWIPISKLPLSFHLFLFLQLNRPSPYSPPTALPTKYYKKFLTAYKFYFISAHEQRCPLIAAQIQPKQTDWKSRTFFSKLKTVRHLLVWR